MKRIAFATFFMFTINTQAIVCIPFSCDPTLSYALAKEALVLKQRLGDVYGAIKSTTEEMRVHNYLVLKDNFELMRIRQRYRIRLKDAMKQSHLVDKFSKIIESGASIQAVRASAILEEMEVTTHAEK